MNEYFKYSPIYSWFHSWKCFFGNIAFFFSWLNWTKQRVFRGYSDCDVWNMFSYLNTILPPMLKQLKDECKSGHPAELHSREEWEDLLGIMIEGFEASKHMEETFHSLEDYKADRVIFEKGMWVFTHWYHNLWD